MPQKISVTLAGAVLLILVGAGCSVPGEKGVINGDYLDQTKPVVSVPLQATATSTTSSVK